MNFVDLPLPSRSIAIAERPVVAPAGFLFTIVIMLALFGGLTVWQGPGLWRDFQISQNPQTLPNADVRDGECNTRRGLTDCEARLVYEYNGQSYDTHVSLAFLDFSNQDYSVDVVISADKPELATVSLGLDMLWNRLAVFAVFDLIFLAGAIGMILAGLRARSANRAVAVPGRLTLVPVQITEAKTIRGANYVTYAEVVKGKVAKGGPRTRFADGQEPLMAVDEEGRVVGVAVKAEHMGLPVLLDSKLERIDLSEIERRKALEAFDAEQARRGGIKPVAPVAKKSPMRAALRGLIAGGAVLVFALLGAVGYWAYYVTSGPNAFDSIGMEINNLMPEPVNLWGCTQLEARFGGERAPYGCTADDYTSWKTGSTTPTTTTKKTKN